MFIENCGWVLWLGIFLIKISVSIQHNLIIRGKYAQTGAVHRASPGNTARFPHGFGSQGIGLSKQEPGIHERVKKSSRVYLFLWKGGFREMFIRWITQACGSDLNAAHLLTLVSFWGMNILCMSFTAKTLSFYHVSKPSVKSYWCHLHSFG